ncbi:MAG: hypothetical protein FJZ04_00540 [Candidatus Moranbacteria bacterium]|nr:hypothetical protein [Candidatus Moranbacteria bacterium]
MLIKTYFPSLHKALSSWTKNKERPPLLLAGFSEHEWKWLGDEIIKLLVGPNKARGICARNTRYNPDIIVLEKEKDKNTIEVKQVRQFIYLLSLSSQNLPYKIGIVPSAQHLTHPSQNALLKTLEEPQRSRYLLLLSPEKNKILPTILSRSLILNLNLKSPQLLTKYLQRNHPEMSYAERKNILSWSGLNLGNAAKMSQNYNRFWELSDFHEKQKKLSPANKLKLGSEQLGDSNSKILDFFQFEAIRLTELLKKDLQKKPRESSAPTLDKLRLILDFIDQSQSFSGASPKSLLDAYLLQN